MKKSIKKISLLLLLLCTICWAQQTKVIDVKKNSFVLSVSFNPDKYKDSLVNKYIIRDFYEYTDLSKPGTFKLPTRDILIAIPPNSKPEFKILSKTENKYENIVPALNEQTYRINDSTISLKKVVINNLVNNNALPNLIEVVGYIWYRDFYCAHLKINKYLYDAKTAVLNETNKLSIEVNFNQQYSFQSSSPLKIKSENENKLKDLIINSDMAEQFRSNPRIVTSDTTGDWINYNSSYVKIGTASDDLFRISKSDLESMGITASSIDPRTFQLFSHGKEIPIFVNNEDSGMFSNSDYIEFYGSKNYSSTSCRVLNSPTQEYNEYLNRYTDTSYFFLTWNQKNGLRSKNNSVASAFISDTLDYYSDLLHVEKNTMYQNLYNDEVENQTPGWLRNKTWYWEWLVVGKKNYTFQLQNLYPNKTINFYSKLVSGASNITNNSHQLVFSVNSLPIDTQSVNRFDQVLLHGSLLPNQLISGSNKLVIENVSNGTSPNYLAIDWYEIEYARQLLLNKDSLYFKIGDDVSTGLKVVKVSEVAASNLVVYKLNKSFTKISDYSIANNILYFRDTVHAGDSYIIIKSDKTKKPILFYSGKFANLRDYGTQADYLAITHPKFIQSATAYLQKISSVYGLTTKLINVQNIFDEFGFGYPYPESIKSFMESAFQNMPTPKPSYLTIIGDADYDYKHYRFINEGAIGGGNYVPAFGNPISDNWYVIWSGSNIPQLMVGRIPINNSSELDFYSNKISSYVSAPYSEYNKRFLFFSGGDVSNVSELAQLKEENDAIISGLIHAKPIAGEYTHFYKTLSPMSDLGPYSNEQIQEAISKGGLLISYIGHSGTATWDNGINETNQLANSVGGCPLITDFGCSTNKYAEPDIVSFGERFVLNNSGQALNYIGNSSLGFTSTATSVPYLFYESLVNDSMHIVGSAHLDSKIKMFSLLGTSSVANIFSLTNIIIGDPSIHIKFPTKPNLKISSSDIMAGNNITEIEDSTRIQIVIHNLGLAPEQNVQIKLLHSFNNNIIEQKEIFAPIPEYLDTINTWINVKNIPGNHEIAVSIDPDNTISEMYESDNTAQTSIFVSSQAIRDLIPNTNENSLVSQITVLNPSLYSKDPFNIIVQTATNSQFNNSYQYSVPSQTFFTKIPVTALEPRTRYWFRYKMDESSSVFSLPKSFYNYDNKKFYLTDSLTFNNQNLKNLNFNNNHLVLTTDSVKISVLSSGFYAGATCVISKDGMNQLASSFFAGMGIVVFDEKTMKVDTTTYYTLFGQPTNVQKLADLINAIPAGKIVVMGVADDARNNLSAALKNAIKTLGSTKIDSLAFRGSWAIIGKKGAAASEVIEKVKGPYNGSVTLEKSFIAPNSEGNMVTKQIGPAAQWKTFYYNTTSPSNSKIDFSCLGIRSNGNVDTLKSINYADSTASLSQIDSKLYPKLKIVANYRAATDGTTPEIKNMAVDYVQPPELGLNYQTVSLSSDSVIQGKSIKLDFSVYNVGEIDADSFHVNVYLNLPNKTQRMFLDTLVTNLEPLSKISKNVNYDSNYDDGYGSFSFSISVDKENKISETFKDNNYFNKSFYIIKDSITAINTASISYTFDGLTIMDGDYVSSKPKIEFRMSYDYNFVYKDTSKINFLLDGKKLLYSSMDSIRYDTINRLAVYQIRPQLSDGEHVLKITGEGLVNKPTELQKSFNVSSELKILDVYNYPNPFESDTYFTFNLTVIPDEITIKIFTVTGRLIKEIKPSVANLNVNFNRIYWDGRDEDGDVLANGVYLYKVIAKLQDKTCSNIQKIAKVQ